METKELKILYLEDSIYDAEFVKRVLKNAGLSFTFKLVDEQDAYQQALVSYQPDLILADHSMFQFNSFEALRLFKEQDLKIPFILVTGTVSEEFAVSILKAGADDYLLKDNLARLPNAILNALEKRSLENERQQYLSHIIASESVLKEAEYLANFGSWQADMLTGKYIWSDEMFRIYGYQPNEIVPNYEISLSHVHPEDRASLKSDLKEVLKSTDAYEYEFRIIDKNNLLKYIHSKIRIERNAGGQPIRLSGFNQDITERKKTEQQLQQLNKDLKANAADLSASNQELERFAYVASHDLQEPLRMVTSFLGLLNKKLAGKLDDTTERYIHFALDGAERMNRMILDLLQFSRVGTSKEDLVNVDCNDLLQTVKSIFHLRITESNATLDVKPLPVIKAIQPLMQQLFQNLVGNALKYDDKEKPVITVGCDELANLWQFYVKDNGIGIDPKFFDKIFVIFQRLHSRSEYSGTGIGLAICKKIVERHGGNIWVESSPGKGSSFYFTIPK
ncbi:MAG: ATP-binding protein [Ferruginibacter sp.]